MLTLLFFITLLALAIWIGTMIYLSFVVTPLAFSVLEIEDAGRFVRALFSRYYMLGIACGLAILAGFALSGWLKGSATGVLWLQGVPVLIMTALAAYSWAMVSRINAARDAGETQHALFQRLHRRSVIVNIAMLVLGLFVLALISYFRTNA